MDCYWIHNDNEAKQTFHYNNRLINRAKPKGGIYMSEVTREVPTTTVTVKTIRFMDGGGLPQPTETTAETVADLRKPVEEGGMGLTGSIIVNEVVASSDGSTPINDGDRVSHVSGGKRGGK